MLAAVTIEFLKLRRSRVFRTVNAIGAMFPILTAAVFVFLRTVSGFDDDTAVQRLRNADWSLYIQVNTQLLTIGAGLMLFALMGSYIFAREYREETYPGLLMTSMPRWRIVVAKFTTLFVWMAWIAAIQVALTLLIGWGVGIGPVTAKALGLALRYIAGTTFLFFLTVPMMSLLACLGRGYLAPMTLATAALIASVPLTAGDMAVWLPWSIPIAYAASEAALQPLGSAILGMTFIAGVAGTVLTYYRADARN